MGVGNLGIYGILGKGLTPVLITALVVWAAGCGSGPEAVTPTEGPPPETVGTVMRSTPGATIPALSPPAIPTKKLSQTVHSETRNPRNGDDGGLDSLFATPPPTQGNLSQHQRLSRGVRRGNDGREEAGSEMVTEKAPPIPASVPEVIRSVKLEQVLGGLEFDAPTNLAQAPDGLVLVAEQEGRILAFPGEALSSTDAAAEELLDIRDRVRTRGSEEGLLGLALSPDFAETGHFFVYYSASDPRRSVVSRFTNEAGEERADPDSELVILEVAQPYSNHNGGQIAFGPDGHLYIGLGDGGSAGDPLGSGQDTSTLLGSILRIDVSAATPQEPYRVPADNPFADGGGRGEIWAYGLRNPWRFSFDRATGEMWAGDVGQNRWEEIDLIEGGGNYGWNTLEGNHCFAPSSGCRREGTVPPAWEYPLEGGACSVIGGYVYRGEAIPWLGGVYVFGDFCTGEVMGLRQDGGRYAGELLTDTGLRIVSFGQDNAGELYVLSQRSGIFRLAPGP